MISCGHIHRKKRVWCTFGHKEVSGLHAYAENFKKWGSFWEWVVYKIVEDPKAYFSHKFYHHCCSNFVLLKTSFWGFIGQNRCHFSKSLLKHIH